MTPRQLLTTNNAQHLLNSKVESLTSMVEHTQTTLYVRCVPQQMIPLKSQSGGAVCRDESITPRAKQRAQDPLLCQGPVSGCPQRLTQRLELPTASTRAPWHHRQHGVYVLHPLLHLLQPPLGFPQFLHQVLNKCVLQSVVLCARLVL